MKKFEIKPSLSLWLRISVVIVVIIPLYYFILMKLITSPVDRGLFGDSFGFINAIFTGLAFSGVIVTILMQRSELVKQREDLEIGRKEDEKQRFEKLIFMLITLHLDIIEKLDFLSKKRRDVFDAYLETIRTCSQELEAFDALRKLSSTQLTILSQITSEEDLISKIIPGDGLDLADIEILKEVILKKEIIELFNSKDHDDHIAILKKAIKKSRKSHKDVLAHYFRNLYNIFKTIDQATFLSITEKQKLANLVRAQLSNSEMVAIFYNSIVEIDEDNTGIKPLGYPKMTRLLKKYQILKHLGDYSLFHPFHSSVFDKACEKALEGEK